MTHSWHPTPPPIQRIDDPLTITAHIHITASAGSGKTKNLIDRLCKLLLQGAEPRSVVCLTFTKNAAHEMTERLHQRLSFWVTADEVTLTQELQSLGERENPRARQLFFSILDHPLRIQTLHSFCQGLLMRFPLESGLLPGFSLCDELQNHSLLEEARQKAFNELDVSIKAALATHVSLKDLQEALTIILQQASKENAYTLPPQPPQPPGDPTLHTLLLNHKPLIREIIQDAQNSPAAQEIKNLLQDFLITPHPSSYQWLCHLVLTQKGTPRALRGFHETLQPLLIQLQNVILQANQSQQSAKAKYAGTLLNYLAFHIQTTYTQRLHQRGLTTYDHLIKAATRLLTQNEAPWVLQTLHKEISHVLVDEAQDNSQPQWAIITALLEGLSRFDQTLFMVGDPKQSIYGFQGATPQAFETFGRHLHQVAHENHKPCLHHTLDTSFRSSPILLKVVDATFQPLWGSKISHKPCAAKSKAPGLVELWPPLRAAAAEAELSVASHVAFTLSILMNQTLSVTGSPIQPQDILILLRRRGTFCETLVRALKRQGLPVTGTDRFMLNQEIVIQDLLAVGWFALLPDDDLNLASLLKGPLFHCCEDAIFLLGYGRRGSLWQRLRHADPGSPWGSIARELRAWLEARGQAPYTFFHTLIRLHHADTKLLRHSGAEAREPIESFLQLALSYERLYPASLQGFMQWVTQEGRVMARSPQGSPDALRVMTIHGAKGLQAPIVFLLDACTPPRKLPPLLHHKNHWFYSPSAASMPPELSKQRETLAQEMMKEYQRLLYVALTRAQERLYVWQWASSSPPQACWHSWLSRGMASLAETQSLPFEGPGGGQMQRIGSSHQASSSAHRRQPALCQRPSWKILEDPQSVYQDPSLASSSNDADAFQTEATQHPHPTSQASDTPRHPLSDRLSGLKQATDEGTLWHRVLELVPPSLDFKDEACLTRWLQETLLYLGEPEAGLQKSLTLLKRVIQTHSTFFGPGSQAEVPCVTTQGPHFLGRVDRLVHTPQALMIIDFKRHVPLPVPQDFCRQLAIYRKLFTPLAQGKKLETLLLSLDDALLYPVNTS